MLGLVGILATISYVVFLTWFQYDALTNAGDLPLNEFGDFLAGAFGPVAIFWLVLGFFLQGRELRNSIKTLELQTEELRNSVEQQKMLAEVAKEQLLQERKALHEERLLRQKAFDPNWRIDNAGRIV